MDNQQQSDYDHVGKDSTTQQGTFASLKELFYETAKNLKEAFPSYEKLSIGDITLGLVVVANQHYKDNLIHVLNENIEPQFGMRFKTKNKFNPDGVSIELMYKCRRILEASNRAYYPEIYSKAENTLVFSCESKLLQPPFFVSIDHDNQNICIAIRGTGSFHDMFTNLAAVPDPFSCFKYYKENDSEELIHGSAHRGMTLSAKWILEQIQPKLLETLEKHPDYSILCCGHSLGGGTCVILGILLRDLFKKGILVIDGKKLLPNIECVTFGPAAMLSLELSRWCKSFVTSFIIGADIIPRLSAGQAEDLRIEIEKSHWYETVQHHLQTNYGSYFVIADSYLSKFGLPTFKSLVQKQTVRVQKTSNQNTKKEVITIDKQTTVNTVTTDSEVKSTTSQQEKIVIEEPKKDIEESKKIEGPKEENKEQKEPKKDNEEPKKEIKIEKQYPPGDLYIFLEDVESVEQPTYLTAFKTAFRSIMEIYYYGMSEEELMKITKERMRKKKFIIRHVDALHFSRIVLSPMMFSDHGLLNFFYAFDFVTQTTDEYANAKIM